MAKPLLSSNTLFNARHNIGCPLCAISILLIQPLFTTQIDKSAMPESPPVSTKTTLTIPQRPSTVRIPFRRTIFESMSPTIDKPTSNLDQSDSSKNTAERWLVLPRVYGVRERILQSISHGPEREQAVIEFLLIIKHQSGHELVDGCKTLSL
jgi:hypothetical protein